MIQLAFFRHTSDASLRPTHILCGIRHALIILLAYCLLNSPAWADDMRPAYLGIIQSDDAVDTFDVTFKVPARAGQFRFALGVEFDEQTEQIENNLVQYFLDDFHESHWQVRRAGGLEGSQVTIFGLSRTSSEVLVRIEYLDGTSMTQRLTPAAPQFIVPDKPTWIQTAGTYFVLGLEHILFGADHLLFVLALLMLISGMRKLLLTITAFTLAHSITLISASLNLIHLPIPPVEACIALSIVFIAVEILHVQQGRTSLTARHPWLVAFGFGLLHGLGFASALGEIGLPQNAVATALVVFNLGVEAGQLCFVGAFVAARLLLNHALTVPNYIKPIPAYAVGGIASFWMIERVAGFWS